MKNDKLVLTMTTPDGTLVQRATMRMPKTWDEMSENVPVLYEGPPVWMTRELGYSFDPPKAMHTYTPDDVIGVRGMFCYYAKASGLNLQIDGENDLPPHPDLHRRSIRETGYIDVSDVS